MDTIQIFKKTVRLVWRYRATWLFGCLLALTMNSTLWLGFISNNDQGTMIDNQAILPNGRRIYFPGQGMTIGFRSPGMPVVEIEGLEPGWYIETIGGSYQEDLQALLISIGIVLLVSILLAVLLHYTSLAALIGMVDEAERGGKLVSIRRGFRLGWSRVAGKLFLIDLSINLPAAIFFGLVFCLCISPTLLFGLGTITANPAAVIGIIMLTTAGVVLFAFLVLAAALILSITRPVMHRACAVGDLGVGASIRRGFTLLKSQFTPVITTWLLWIAVRLVWTVAILPVLVILLPVLLLTLLVGALASIPLILICTGIASLFVSTVFAWVIGVVFAAPLFLLITFSPIIFLDGWVANFKTGFWTLSYRDFSPLAVAAPQPTDPSESVKLSTVQV
jgi:hypothetical protein